MKKVLLLLFGVILLTGTLQASQHEIVKDADDLKIRVLMENDPPLTGENNLKIVLADSEGIPVTKAKIKVDYSMPPMGNMPPMLYKARAKFDGEGYKAKINLSMSGPWNVAVSIKRPGKSLTRMEFQVKVP
ncbi:MAG TPA: hypothetical protein ENG83_06500 [Nitrospirae bacterium]|nr:hypothetical protein BMS3Abin06_01080 [bacterium BMS3Abin06]HDH11831.1 hypothetical protein [Nitrospirota bacterium]HDZ02827.1 hypothetical protein [Nitrospirota bacterium]